jgi:signal transduction histidine kinase
VNIPLFIMIPDRPAEARQTLERVIESDCQAVSEGRDEIYRIASEAVPNAFRRAQAGRIEVEIVLHSLR